MKPACPEVAFQKTGYLSVFGLYRTDESCQIFFGFRASLWYLTSGKSFMVKRSAVPEISGGVVFHLPDASTVLKRADAINVNGR